MTGHAAAILGGQLAEEGWMSQGIPRSDLKTCGWKLQLLQLKNLLKITFGNRFLKEDSTRMLEHGFF